ncbi:hypothetical protein RCL1_000530 [Eukaryota sp. TZLM3-RCL]
MMVTSRNINNFLNSSVGSLITRITICLAFCFNSAVAAIPAYLPQTASKSLQSISDEVSQMVSQLRQKGASFASMNPVVLIPGFSASALGQKLTDRYSSHWYCLKNQEFTTKWVSLTQFLPEMVNCFLENFQPVCDLVEQSCTDPLGVFTRPIGNYEEGDTFAVEHLDPSFKWKTGYMYTFIEALHQLGLQRQEHVFALPYDWRLIGIQSISDELETRFTRIVERAFEVSNGKKVNLIGHSMGGLVGVSLLNKKSKEWKQKFINHYVSVAAPFSGAPTTPHNILVGENYGVPTLTKPKSRNLIANWTGVAALSPRDFTYGQSDLIVVDGKAYTSKDLKKLYTKYNANEHLQFLDWNLHLVSPTQAPDVAMTVIGTTNIRVPLTYNLTRNGRGEFDVEVLKYEDGDGTVHVRSYLDILKYWNEQQKEKITFVPYKDVGHTRYFMNHKFVGYLINYLSSISL